MSYEMIEQRISEINTQVTNINNLIVKLTWLDKNFTKSKIKILEKEVNILINEKYELLDLIA